MIQEEIKSSPGLNMEHGFVRKIEQTQHIRQNQLKTDAFRRQEAAKLAKKIGMSKSSKPTMEIYRPPSVRLSGDFSCSASGENGQRFLNETFPQNIFPATSEASFKPVNRVHFQIGPNKPSSTELKSALKRSKSFGGADLVDMSPAAGLEREAFPAEYQSILRRALHDPNTLTCRQIMELVRIVCGKAVENLQNAEPAAHMCFAIIEKEKTNTFLESLLNSCREWYNERDKLLRLPSSNSLGAGGSRRWLAYISFLTELYMRLKSRHRSAVLAMQSIGDGSSAQTPTSYANQTLPLLVLIYDCCEILLKPPSLSSSAEIESLHSVVTSVGRQLETDAPQRMNHLVDLMRDAFVMPSISSQVRKTLLELVELHASQWQLDLPQSMYYFPYTSVDRK